MGKEKQDQAPTGQRENVGLLEGMKCPSCGSIGPFDIMASVTDWVRVSDEGTGGPPEGDIIWDKKSDCRCVGCGHLARVEQFRNDDDVADAAFEWTAAQPVEITMNVPVISSTHIPESLAREFNRAPESQKTVQIGSGWFIYVGWPEIGGGEQDAYGPEVTGIVRILRERGWNGEWLLIDGDGSTIAGLPTFDW